MFTANWYEHEDLRYDSCLEAVCGHYGVLAQQVVKGPDSSRHRLVFARMLTLCCVSDDTVVRRTGLHRYEVASWINVAKTVGALRQTERMTVNLLMRHLAMSPEADPDYPPKDRDSECEYSRYEAKLRNLDRARERLRYAFCETGAGERWRRKFKYCGSFLATRHYQLVSQSRLERSGVETDSVRVEDRRNDRLVMRCMATIAEPVDWHSSSGRGRASDQHGEIVFLVQGYQLALGLTDAETTRFETDARVVLVQGNSCTNSSRPNRCLLFLTGDEARRFDRSYGFSKPSLADRFAT